MKTIGEILKTERKKQEKTLNQIHQETRIPLETLKAIEEDNFTKLPSAAFVKGFLKNYAQVLSLDPQKTLAFFRRDWEQNSQGEIVPKGLSVEADKFKFSFTPKTTLILVFSFVVLLFFVYFGFQLRYLLLPPRLKVESPTAYQEVNQETIEVRGSIDEEASVYINDQLISTDKNGSFSYRFKLYPGENTIEIKAIDRQSKETVIERKIKRVDKNSFIINTKING